MTDALSLVQATRPGPAIDIGVVEPGAVRTARRSVIEDHNGQARDPSELDSRPGSPGYLSKIPPPPCALCSNDHNPMYEAQGRYGHAYVHPRDVEPKLEVLSTAVVPPVEGVPAVAPASTAAPVKRMTLFPGKADNTYLLVVEEREGDDWEDVMQVILANTVLKRVLPVFDALGLKIKDRTGGDLVMLRNPEDAG